MLSPEMNHVDAPRIAVFNESRDVRGGAADEARDPAGIRYVVRKIGNEMRGQSKPHLANF
jgi:hypothetical protein